MRKTSKKFDRPLMKIVKTTEQVSEETNVSWSSCQRIVEKWRLVASS
jgi:hypothetical protein